MPVYKLPEEPVFPRPDLAEEDGLLAIGGDLSTGRLLNAYASGIFPWYSKGQPILWWSPDPRMVLFPKNFIRHKNLRRTVDKNVYTWSFDQHFKQVVEQCSRVKRKGQAGTWITDEMKDAYVHLHKLGFAHSVETYDQGKLAGGLYGVSLGSVFFGESMFHLKTDASKVALWHLVDFSIQRGIKLIDVQQDTTHLKSLGAETISREKFLVLLRQNLRTETLQGNWQKWNDKKTESDE
jgi:leucyl/phenylalanyl-tRNA--protein transferase